VRTFLPTWLAIKSGRVRPKTLAIYQYYCELAETEIGGYRMDEVTREHADALLTYFHSINFKNVDQLRSTLAQAFEYALEEDYIRKNPFKKAKAPIVERKKAVALTVAQRNALLREVAGTPLCGLWHFYSRLGFRRGEGLGLLWSNINWDAGTVSITQQYAELNGRIIKSAPKTKRSERTIPIPLNLLDILRKHREWQRERAAAIPGWEDNDLIFPDDLGRPRHPSSVLYTFKQLVKRLGLPPMTIHHLRHTAQYRLEQDGAPLSIRMAILGHTSIAMAGHYGDHADLEAMRQVISSIA
jgi:integrase